jgi:hypothetical protein
MTTTYRNLLLLSLLAGFSQSAVAAPMRYQGQLIDAGTPATGFYDLHITLYDAADGGNEIGYPSTLTNVPVLDGQFQVDFDTPLTAVNSTAWLQASVREAGTQGSFMPLRGREMVTLQAQIAACWSTTGDTGSNPAVNYLGNSDNQTLVLSSPTGVSVNKRAQINLGSVDLLVAPKATGDADGDVGLESRNGRRASMFVRDSSGALVLASDTGIIEMFDGVPLATQNAGSAVVVSSGRMRIEAAGAGATDTSGGIWLDDEVPQRSYLGRGTNNANWTGVFADNVWRMAVHDDGLVSINNTAGDGTLNGVDLLVAARPTAGDADADLGLVSRSGRRARWYVTDVDGVVRINALDRTAGANYILTGNGASLSGGGTWTNASSRELKEGFAAIDPLAMLAKVVSLPISTWTYKSSSEGLHLGPIAEDFKATFGLAGDGKSISTVDADGVALAAIQGLNAKLEAQNAELRAQLARVEAALQALGAPR